MMNFWTCLLLALTPMALAQDRTLGRKAVESLRAQHEGQLVQEYFDFLSIPNVAADKANIRRNTEFIMAMMKQRGIPARLLDGDSPNANPAVFGEVKAAGAKKTIIFYAHYDGQPVNPADWAKGLAPFAPVFISAPMEQGGVILGGYKQGQTVSPDWRISGRSAADDKAGVMSILNAYWALVEAGQPPRVNIKFFFEGEEEAGSTHLAEILAKHHDLLGSDLWVFVDGPRHPLGLKLVEFGVRGDVNLALTVYGPKRGMHSGNYGNWVPNPAMRLVKLLAGMKDDHDHVLIPGFYDDVVPLSEREKQAIAAMPNLEPALKAELGIAKPDGEGARFGELLMRPTLNINGIRSANVGAEATNIIPSKAEATLDLRLVKGNTLTRQVGKVVDYIKAQGFHVMDHEPTDEERRQYDKLIHIEVGSGYDAQRTPMDLPIARDIIAAVQSTSQEPVVAVPSAGGSLPLVLFEKELGANLVTVPVVNYDNNQHTANENVQVRFLWEGIETLAAIMSIE